MHRIDGVNPNAYLVLDREESTLSDTGMPRNAERILDYVDKMNHEPSEITTIVLTHCHIDHAGGAQELKQLTNAKVAVHKEDGDSVAGNRALPSPKGAIGTLFRALSTFVIHTPSHAPGSISSYDSDRKVIFVGDTTGFTNGKISSAPKQFTLRIKKALESIAETPELEFGVMLSRLRLSLNIRRHVVSSPEQPRTKPVQVSGEKRISSIRVTAPCTTANLGPGFDVFGLALEAFHDTIQIEPSSERGVELEVAGLDSETVPEDPNLNSAGLVAKHLLAHLEAGTGLKICVEKGIPVGRGLGSSAASAAATIVGLNCMYGLNLTQNEIVEIAALGEVASAGARHADNVAAAILGGFTFVQSYSPLSIVALAPPRRLEVAIAIPEIPVPRSKTESARALLPEMVPLREVVQNVGGAASIVAGILSENIALIGKGMIDAIVEPVRARSVPGYAEVKRAALEAGAEGVAISGAGPSMIAIVDNARVSTASVAEAMREAFESAGVKCRALGSRPARGATVLRE